MMMWATFSLSVLLMSLLNHGSAAAPLVYRVTVRDFLPIWCMPVKDVNDLGILDNDSIMNNISDDDDRRWNLHEGSFCPYQEWIDNGTISGHPDFNRPHVVGWYMDFMWDIEDTYGSDAFVVGSCGVDDLNGNPRPGEPGAINVGECRANAWLPFTKRVNLTEMDIAPSGIPKPQYCQKGDDVRCGYAEYTYSGITGGYTNANKFFHDMWFLDNRKYNKRVGSTLNLNPKGDGVFNFDAGTDDENDNVVAAVGLYAPHGTAELVFNESDHPDPFEAPVWPDFDSGNVDTVKGYNKYLHTSEIHTFFEYRGNEFFTFKGDDDIWVYINGRIAVEMGGLHRATTGSINLSSPLAAAFLNLTVGEIYTFDLYQAERQPTGSNFAVTTTLSSACNVLLSGKDVLPSTDGDSFKMSRRVTIDHTEGDPYAGQDISLVTTDMVDSSSFFFSNRLLNIGTGFIVAFDFIATGEPAGFTFLLHRREEDLTNFPKSSGATLGFTGVKNSVAIAFDFCKDRESSTDCIDQDVSVYFPEDASSANKPSVTNRRVYDPIIRSQKYGERHSVTIEYFFKPPALEVTIDNSLYLREMPFDPIESLESVAAYAGFTATSGSSGSSGTITIGNWSMKAVDVESSKTLAVDFDPITFEPFEVKEIVADNMSAAGFAIQTRDFCEAPVEFGGRAGNSGGIYVERPQSSRRRLQYANGATTPLIIEVEIEDNQDGQYRYNLVSGQAGVYDLYFFYGDSEKTCTFNYSFVENNVTGFTEVVVIMGNATIDGCFYGIVEEGVIVNPLTEAPTAAPVTITVPPAEVDDTVLYVAGVGGGTLAIFGSLACCLFFVYARRWRKDKEYIEEGIAYRNDVQTTYNNHDELTQAGREVQATQAAILRARMQKARDKREVELAKLQEENEELLEQIRLKKNVLDIQNHYAPERVPSTSAQKVNKIEMVAEDV